MGILLEHISPNGNIEAIVEQDDRVAFFYVRGNAETGLALRSCWVRNLGPAPQELDVPGMKRGIPPMLPRAHCAHPMGQRLNAQDLRIVWFEEGEGAALLEADEPIAIIPPWSGMDGFHGYARDCLNEASLCWPLSHDNAVLPRIARAEQFWAAWDKQPDPWAEIQHAQFEAYTKQLGPYEKYYAIDGGSWPPKALIRTPVPRGFALTTIGVGLRPQPAVEMATQDPQPFRRIELGIGLSEFFQDFFHPVARYISAQSNLPWVVYSWLGPGHTIPCDAFAGTSFAAVILQYAPLGAPNITLPSFREDPAKLLWAIPITEQEQQYAAVNGSAALLGQLRSAGVSWLTQPRKSVI